MFVCSIGIATRFRRFVTTYLSQLFCYPSHRVHSQDEIITGSRRRVTIERRRAYTHVHGSAEVSVVDPRVPVSTLTGLMRDLGFSDLISQRTTTSADSHCCWTTRGEEGFVPCRLTLFSLTCRSDTVASPTCPMLLAAAIKRRHNRTASFCGVVRSAKVLSAHRKSADRKGSLVIQPWPRRRSRGGRRRRARRGRSGAGEAARPSWKPEVAAQAPAHGRSEASSRGVAAAALPGQTTEQPRRGASLWWWAPTTTPGRS
jgi:hypothetical protein